MESKIVVYPNLISHEQCTKLINDIDAKQSEDTSYFSGYEQDYGIKKKRCPDHELVKYICDNLCYDLDSAALVYYPTNSFNGIHCDNSINENGIWKRIKSWERTAILFCNNNFTGGELIYPEQGCVFIPTVGTIIETPAGPEYLHSVNKVITGERYTLVLRIK